MSSLLEYAVIGGGIAGVTITHHLAERSRHSPSSIALFEKSRRLGGRASMIPISQEAVAPLGVSECSINRQQVTSSILFKKLMMIDNTDHLQAELDITLPTSLWEEAQSALESLDPISLHLSHTITKITLSGDKRWLIDGERWVKGKKQSFNSSAKRLIITCPTPQTTSLLRTAVQNSTSEVTSCLTPLIDTLSRVTFTPRWCTLIKTQSSLSALRSIPNDLVEKIAHTSQPDIFVVHSSAQWSEHHLESDSTEVSASLREMISEYTSRPIEIIRVHRWRYAGGQRESDHSDLYWPTLGLGLCGDMLVRGTFERGVQRAVQSAITLIDQLDSNNHLT